MTHFTSLFALHWWHGHYFWGLGWWGFGSVAAALHLLVRAGLAFFVYQDARRRSVLLLDIPPWLWAGIVVVFGLWGAVAYWLAHYAGIAGTPGARTG